ncbi:hypothetical protein [Billgrantia aerodenitrificans]|uniref:Uncharacterized protein n=2 Tax=Halomonadaceae TaxID=28256 RepID=A0ABS9AV10_9GAMM|nr:hypothetical protein [Halomonas aerodenitrificans]MCE8025589.1 hypothetical protein [Halomonas aerodenitrificans]
MDMTRSLLLLPHEQLTLAYEHEAAELQRYRRLTLRFLPRAPQTSRLMATLGLQCEKRLGQLHQVAVCLELEACIVRAPGNVAPFPIPEPHFFIVDEVMGEQMIEHAIRAAMESKHFFDWMLNTNATAELHRPLLNFVSEKEGECRVLLEYWEQHRAPAVAQRA